MNNNKYKVYENLGSLRLYVIQWRWGCVRLKYSASIIIWHPRFHKLRANIFMHLSLALTYSFFIFSFLTSFLANLYSFLIFGYRRCLFAFHSFHFCTSWNSSNKTIHDTVTLSRIHYFRRQPENICSHTQHRESFREAAIICTLRSF